MRHKKRCSVHLFVYEIVLLFRLLFPEKEIKFDKMFQKGLFESVSPQKQKRTVVYYNGVPLVNVNKIEVNWKPWCQEKRFRIDKSPWNIHKMNIFQFFFCKNRCIDKPHFSTGIHSLIKPSLFVKRVQNLEDLAAYMRKYIFIKKKWDNDQN